MPLNPVTGVARPEYPGSAGSFVVEHPYPHERGATRTRLVYYAPESRTPLGVVRRQTVTIELTFPESLPGHRPYYFELDRQPERETRRYDTLRLYVDREVRIRLPRREDDPTAPRAVPRGQARTVRGPWGKWFRLDVPNPYDPRSFLPEIDPGGRPAAEQGGATVHLLIHRNQSLGAVPQSPADLSTLFTSVLEVGPSFRASTSETRERGGVTIQQWSRGYCEMRGLADGGTELVLGTQGLTRAASRMGVGWRTGHRATRGVVRLRYSNSENPGRYDVQFRRHGRNLVVVVLLQSRNVYATFDVVGANEDVTTQVRGQSLLERAREAFEGVGLQLQFVDASTVPRPGQGRRVEGVPWHQSDLLARHRLHLAGVRDPGDDLLYDIFATELGFVPIVGDIFDIGQLAYGLLTGEDFTGRELDALDLMWMGLAVLPLVPHMGRLLDATRNGYRTARKIAEESELGLDGLRALIRLRRPALDLLGTLRGGGSQLVTRRAVASGLARDGTTARALRLRG